MTVALRAAIRVTPSERKSLTADSLPITRVLSTACTRPDFTGLYGGSFMGAFGIAQMLGFGLGPLFGGGVRDALGPLAAQLQQMRALMQRLAAQRRRAGCWRNMSISSA